MTDFDEGELAGALEAGEELGLTGLLLVFGEGELTGALEAGEEPAGLLLNFSDVTGVVGFNGVDEALVVVVVS